VQACYINIENLFTIQTISVYCILRKPNWVVLVPKLLYLLVGLFWLQGGTRTMIFVSQLTNDLMQLINFGIKTQLFAALSIELFKISYIQSRSKN